MDTNMTLRVNNLVTSSTKISLSHCSSLLCARVPLLLQHLPAPTLTSPHVCVFQQFLWLSATITSHRRHKGREDVGGSYQEKSIDMVISAIHACCSVTAGEHNKTYITHKTENISDTGPVGSSTSHCWRPYLIISGCWKVVGEKNGWVRVPFNR